MKKGQKIKIVMIVMVGVMLDIFMHIVTSPFSTIREDANFSMMAITLGTEITATLWALCAFSGVAFVFLHIRDQIPGEGVKKGLRFGTAIGLLWLFAMLEGVSLFGNPLIKEFIVGLSDAIPVFVMSILLSLLRFDKVERGLSATSTIRQKINTVLVFMCTFLTGRYIAYYSGVIQSGLQSKPLRTFIWTLFMGFFIGLVFVLLNKTGIELSLRQSTLKFGLLIFGINWALFLLFMPLLFTGYFTDALFRIIIDVTFVLIASFLTLSPKLRFTNKHVSLIQEGFDK